MRQVGLRETVITVTGAVCLLITACYWRIEATRLPHDSPRDLAMGYYETYGLLGAGLAALVVIASTLRTRAPRLGRAAMDIGAVSVMVIAMVQSYASFLA